MNQEESEHNEVDGMKKGVDSKGEVMHMNMICIGGLVVVFCIQTMHT